MAGLTATGIGSGIDISGMVTQLVAAERSTSDQQLARATTKASTEVSALGALKSVLSSFQGSLNSLNTLSSFDKKSASSSDATAVAVIARAKAIPNTYAVEVSQLAAANTLASRSFAATTTAIGTGTVTFRFGTTDYNANTDAYNGFTLNPDSKVTTLTINSGNNTLEGIMKAINDADFGVSASIVQAGDGYKLLLSSDTTGVKNSLEITTADSDGNNTDTGATAGLSNFVFSAAATNLEQTSAAKDANFKINGLALTNAGNTVKDAISGVDLTLSKTTTAPVSVTIRKDTTSAVSAMQNFVSGYNSVVKALASLAGYDATRKQGGPLLGDATVRSIMSQTDAVLRKAVSGLGGDLTSLAAIGVKTGADGTMTLDTTRFTTLLTNSPEQLQPVFQAFAAATDTNIAYKTASDDTKVGNYAVSVSQLATSGVYSGSGVLPDFTPGNYLTLDSNNSSFTVEVDGVSSGTISLTTGEYQSGDALAQEMQARINGTSALSGAGISVKVAFDSSGHRFTLTSDSVGSTSTVKVTAVGTNVAAALGISVQNGTAGVDVAGSVDGKVATGFGNVLTAASTSDANGLQLTVSGGSTGSRGTVNFTRGIANQIDLLFDKLLASTGGLQNRINNYNKQLQTISNKKASQEIHWAAVKDRYMSQFNSLDSLMSKLNSTGTFLTQQLANLPGVVQK